MATPTVASLSRTLGPELAAAPGFATPDTQVSAVHISELLDPTGFLAGGELLLTTGLSLPRSKIACERYVSRLVDAGISALALGLGPVHDAIPEPLVAACRARGLALLVVPPPTPFTKIIRAYWAAVSSTSVQVLQDVLTTQRALVDAAASATPARNLLRILCRSLEAWAVTFTAEGEVDLVQPASALPLAAQVRPEIAKLEGAGVHAAASFPVGASTVLVSPLAVENRVAGYLAVGTESSLDANKRRTVLTASALLSLDSVSRSRVESAAHEVERCVALLVDLGFVEAARRLGGAVHAPALSDRVCILVTESRHSDAVSTAVRRWCSDALIVQTDRRSVWCLVPPDHPPAARLDAALRRADPEAAARLSSAIPVEQVATARPVLARSLARLRSGNRILLGEVEEPYRPDLRSRLDDSLAGLDRPSAEALAAYLRHRGQWEAAARELAVHRNTVRHRIARCEAALGVDLTDPDVAAELWLLLRRRGAA